MIKIVWHWCLFLLVHFEFVLIKKDNIGVTIRKAPNLFKFFIKCFLTSRNKRIRKKKNPEFLLKQIIVWQSWDFSTGNLNFLLINAQALIKFCTVVLLPSVRKLYLQKKFWTVSFKLLKFVWLARLRFFYSFFPELFLLI